MKAVGIDIGTAFIGSARYNKDNISAKYVRDGFFIMPYSPQRKYMLDESKVPFIIKDRTNYPNKQDIYVIGNEAFDMACLFSQELRRPLASGVISPKEPDSEMIVKEILRRVAGDGEQGDIAYYSVPADPIDKTFTTHYHKEMFGKFLTSMGYSVYPLNEAMAVAHSELDDHKMTGLCCSFGSGLVNVALSYMSMEIFSFSIAMAGDFVDQQVAQTRGITISDSTAEKEADSFDLLKPQNDIQEAISIFYKSMLTYVINHIGAALESHKKDIKIKESINFVVAGGTTMPRGFLQMLVGALKEHPLPIPIGKVWQAQNPVLAVCRGCLKAASKALHETTYDGVKDISGNNTKHSYPRAPKDAPPEPEKPKELSPSQIMDNQQRAAIVQRVGGFAEAIDLTQG